APYAVITGEAFFFALGQARYRDHPLVLGNSEQRNAARRPTGDPHIVDGAADQLPAVGDQHHMIAILDGKGRHDRGGGTAPAALQIHAGNAFAPTAVDSVLVGRSAFAEAIVGYAQDVLLQAFQLGQPFGRNVAVFRAWHGLAGRLLPGRPPALRGIAQI